MSSHHNFSYQSWWGKLIGAVLGYLIAGPSGALFGILIGNFFDRSLAEHLSRPHLPYHTEKRKEIQSVFFEATYSTLGHLFKSDGRITEQHIEMAKTIMREMRLNRAQTKAAQAYFNHGKSPNFDLKKMITSLKSISYDNPELLKSFLEIQYRAAQLGGLSFKKQQIMNIILSYLGFAPLNEQFRFYEDFASNQSSSYHRPNSSSSNHQNYRSQPHRNNALEHAYGILEIPTTATQQEVKRAYRRLMSRNHPDKLIARGLPEEMVKKANEKTQKIRKAYDLICENKGW